MDRFETSVCACLLVAIVGGSSRASEGDDFRVTKVRILAPKGRSADLHGGRVMGSLTGPTNDFEEIVAIDRPPGDGETAELLVPPDRSCAYRFVKFQARNDTRGEVAELAFFAGDRKLAGTPFATTGAGEDATDPRLAFDGDPATAYRGGGTFMQYVGLDLGPESQAGAPIPSVAPGVLDGPKDVTLASPTPGATILYSLDASGTPGVDERGRPTGGARAYDGTPIRVASSTIVQAVARKPGLADSAPTVAAYRIGGADTDARAEFHIGNSLTDTVNDWMVPLAASGGHKIRYYRFTIPGAPTDWLWDHPGSGFGETRYAEAFLARAPLSHLITQPFAGHGRGVDNEAEYSGRFFDLAREHSPDVQMWLYVQWPDVDWRRDAWANGRTERGGKAMTFAEPARTWGEAVANHVRYTEMVRDAMDAKRADAIAAGRCRPVRIIPGGPALARLKDEIEAGRVPGLTDFNAAVFAGPGDIHLSKKGAYLIALVHYACLYGEAPEGKVTAAGAGLTPEQARVFQAIAGEVTRGARDAAPGGAK